MSASSGTLLLNEHKAQCDCRKLIDFQLHSHNTTLACNMVDADPCLVLTTKIHEKVRGKPMLIAATYCPFCGKKYLKREG